MLIITSKFIQESLELLKTLKYSLQPLTPSVFALIRDWSPSASLSLWTGNSIKRSERSWGIFTPTPPPHPPVYYSLHQYL